MRFRIDGAGDGGPTPHTTASTSPAPFDHQQRVAFLRLVNEGMGRMTACTQLGLSIRALRRTLAECPSFRRATEQIEQVRAETLYAVLYKAAQNGDTRAALFLLARYDREVEARAARPDPAP